MIKNVAKRAANRPKRELVDRLLTIIWFRKVSLASSKNHIQLGKEFSPDQFKKNIDGENVRPRQWRKYELGIHTPSKALYERVEVVYPGCSVWLSLPIWGLLRCKPPCDEKLQVIMSSIKPNLTKYIGAISDDSGIKVRKNNNRYNYFLDINLKTMMQNQDDILRKFTGLLILVIDAENKEDKTLIRKSLKAAVLLLPYVVDMFFSSIREEFYDVFRDRFVLSNDHIGSELDILRNETPYFDVVNNTGISYPPEAYYLVGRSRNRL